MYAKYLIETMKEYSKLIVLIEPEHKKGFPAPKNISVYPKPKMKYNAGRNEKCPCGSGKKFKQCHGK
jgi:preprotein translocase subunit SecA